ncbi:MAG: D-alanine--D-alanine ligase family protein [Terriglobia bacterium]
MIDLNVMGKKLRVGVLFGGRSGEHEVSLVSAASVIQALDPAKYEVVPIGITKEGRWILPALLAPPAPSEVEGSQVVRSGAEGPRSLAESTRRRRTPALTHSDLRRAFQDATAVVLPAEPSAASVVPLNPAAKHPEPLHLDVVFPVLHGSFGEDGTVQGLLELANLPYIGAGVLGSALGMDKEVQKRLLFQAKLPVTDFVCVPRHRWEADRDAVLRTLRRRRRPPVFVKPANLGSSVGITKVRSASQLAAAIDLAARYDRKIVVERAIVGREFEVSVLGNQEPVASLPGEVIPTNEFYDYAAKYLQDNTRLIVPARLPQHQVKRLQELAVAAFRALECAGMARVDFFLERRTGKIFINELNTIPGFTAISMYPKLWEASGIPYPELLDRLIQLALDRFREKARTRYAVELPGQRGGVLREND